MSRPRRIFGSPRWSKLWENFQKYLRETTVHGFRYISDGHNLFERSFWIVTIFLGFFLNGVMIMRSIEGNYENPILTTIDTEGIDKALFPAITINSGEIMNPWGYIEEAMNMLHFGNFDDPFNPDHPSSKLRQDFHGFLRAIVVKFNNGFERATAWKLNITQLWAFRETLQMTHFSQFEEAVALMALIRERDSRVYNAVLEEIIDVTTKSLAKFSVAIYKTRRLLGTQIIYPPIKKAAMMLNISDSDVASKMTTLMSDYDDENIYYALVKVLQPFAINRIPYETIGFGEILSFFTRKVIATKSRNEEPFLNGKKTDDLETFLESYLRQSLIKLTTQSLNISFYELVKYVDLPYYVGTKGQAPVFQGRINCHVSSYHDLMENFIYHHDSSRFPRDHPCSGGNETKYKKIETCCQYAKVIGSEYDAILKVMKYSQQVPHFLQSNEEVMADFKNISDIFGYPMKSFEDIFAKGNRIIFEPRIFMCQYNQRPALMDTSCNLFSRSFTNEGVGYSFNAGKFWSRQKDTQFNRKFHEIMVYQNQSDPLHPDGFGAVHGLKVALRLNKFMDEAALDENRKSTRRAFKVTLHDPRVPADLRYGGIEIEPGYETTFLITPSEIQTLDNVQDLEKHRRKCQFHFENDLMFIFRDYTMNGCIFECQIKQAFQKCKCIPWNYPHMDHLNPVTCDYMGSFCFENVMADTKTLMKCDCLYDCNFFRYSYSLSSKEFDLDKMCHDPKIQEFYGDSNFNAPNKFMNNFEDQANGKETNEDDICKENLKRTAIVNFQLSSQTMTQIKRGMRVTMTDYIANFGGLFSLFTGMSLLSVVEVIFWILRLVTGSVRNRK